MMEKGKICVHKGAVGDVKRNALAALRVFAKRFGDRGIHFFMRLHAFRRMYVQRNL